MRIEQTTIQKAKLGLHGAQLLFLFIGGCLALAVLTKDGETGGGVGFYFALCFLTLPALVYQVLVPMWTRAWRFANVYAYAGLDLIFTILWLAASIAVGVWQASGVGNGSNGDNNNDDESEGGDNGGCSDFAYGSASKCSVAKASVGFGVVVFLFFVFTTAISIYGLLKYRKTGIMPYGTSDRHGKAEQLPVEDPNKDPWSTNTDELEANQPSNNHAGDDDADLRQAYGQLPRDGDAQTSLLHRLSREDPFHDTNESNSTFERAHPGRPLSYHSGGSLDFGPPGYQTEDRLPQGLSESGPSGYVAPSALSPSGFEETSGGRVNFPTGNYGADFR